MDLIKSILSKNSITALVIGAILVILGAASDFTIGTFTYGTPDTFGRIVFVLLGIIFIGFGFYFTYIEYKTSSLTSKRENSAVSEDQIEADVKYRDIIKLIHFKTSVALHSHGINYHHEGSSKQQQVTGFGGADDNDYWIVKGPHGKDEFYNKGKPIKNGDVIRLEHLVTRRNLHSHKILSPVTKQQEVTAFSPQNNGTGNLDDNWRVEVENGEAWTAGNRIRLIHVNTNAALHSHHYGNEYTSNQQEVTGFTNRNEDDFWLAELVKKIR